MSHPAALWQYLGFRICPLCFCVTESVAECEVNFGDWGFFDRPVPDEVGLCMLMYGVVLVTPARLGWSTESV